jgi:uncharacterized OB-fold protein
MDKETKRKAAGRLLRMARGLLAEADTGTFKCPDCGGKVLNQTKFCVKCDKKVEPKEASARTANIRTDL